MKKSFLVRALEPLLKLPSTPPEIPPGAAATARVFRAAPELLRYRYVGTLISFATAVLGLGVGVIAVIAADQWAALAIIAAVAVFVAVQMLLSFAVVRLDWELRYYVVTDRSLRIREGAWNIRELTLTFLNVQNVTIEQGPLERLFGFSNVSVQTAGGGAVSEAGTNGGHRAVLRGLVNAPEIRDLIRARMEAARKDAGLGDLDDEEMEDGSRLGAAELRLLQEIRAETQALAASMATRNRA